MVSRETEVVSPSNGKHECEKNLWLGSAVLTYGLMGLQPGPLTFFSALRIMLICVSFESSKDFSVYEW